MAHIVIAGNRVRLELSLLEKLGAIR
ncbi:MAG: hypothetical protein RLZZ87_12, partial [Actinomycetota bacterium]